MASADGPYVGQAPGWFTGHEAPGARFVSRPSLPGHQAASAQITGSRSGAPSSFTFKTPEGHTLSAWITFSARRGGDVTIAKPEAFERPSDPFDELAYMLGGNRQNEKSWQATLGNLAKAVGVATPIVETKTVCIDKNRQWRYWRNVRNSATIRSARRTLTAPVRKLTGRG
jgi:hypothetical protein